MTSVAGVTFEALETSVVKVVEMVQGGTEAEDYLAHEALVVQVQGTEYSLQPQCQWALSSAAEQMQDDSSVLDGTANDCKLVEKVSCPLDSDRACDVAF